MKLLSLDQASHTTGYAIFEDRKPIVISHFNAKGKDIAERLVNIRQTILKLIADNEIDTVAFEDIQLQNNVLNNVQTFKVLAEVFGIIDELLTEKKIPHIAVLASSWKSTLSIKGKTRPEQKRNAQAYVEKTYGVKATQDESDAICIGSHYAKKNTQADKIVDGGFSWSI